MDFLQALILGTVQGLTEFIPVSSSGHLVLAEAWLRLDVESLKAFDVMVHLGTLVAIFVYFWEDFYQFILAVWHLVKRTPAGEVSTEIRQHQRWLGYIILGSVPAGMVGVLYEDWIDTHFRDPVMVAGVMFVVGVLFLLAEWRLSTIGRRGALGQDGAMVRDKAMIRDGGALTKSGRHFSWGRGFLIGCAQAVALIPGVSRSGSTIAAAIAMGIPREKAARFSFLLGAPAIFGAGLITSLKLFKNGLGDVGIDILLVGFVSSAVVGYMCVAFLMKFLKKHTLLVFAIYLIALSWVVISGYLFFGWVLSDVQAQKLIMEMM